MRVIQIPDTTTSASLRVDACVMLAGGIKPSELESQARTPTLDLWINDSGTVLDRWVSAIVPVMDASGVIRIAHSSSRAAVGDPEAARSHAIELVPESGAYRGPAGVVRDCCVDLAPEAHVLIVEASKWVGGSLEPMLASSESLGATTLVGVNPDGSPSGLYLTRRGALDCVPSKGFMDIKEQWLPRVQESTGGVYVYRVPAPGTLPIRTREQVLRTLDVSPGNAFVSRGGLRVEESAVSSEASIAPSARVVRSIVMPGAVLEQDALVIRSVVCAGAHVGMGERVIDQVRASR
ncbi:MAG: LbetaH domain-containing protein [Planctomycetota bacterium]